MSDHTHPPRRRHRGVAITTTLALGGAALFGAAAFASPAAAAPSGAAIDTVDYIEETYGVADSVVETVTFERFEWLLGQEGRFAFLVGGAADETTTASLATIDAAAKAAGVDQVFTFDPKLDGHSLDIRTTTNPDVAPLWTRVVANALSKDTQTPFDGTDDPYFFVYDKSHTEGGVEDRIVSALTAPVTSAQLADPAALAAYRTAVAGVFTAAGTLSESSQFAFTSSAVNAKHFKDYKGADAYGGPTILTDADSDWRVQTVTYPELVNLLESDGDFVLFFGGTWCHNTRAVLQHVNAEAVENDVEKVYFFDLRLDGASSNDLHIRDTGSEYADFYGDLVTKHLPNLVTQYVPKVSGQVDYYPGGDRGQALATAKKLQVPYVLEYERGRIVDGKAAPVVRQWIHDNGDGTYKEYMTEWWYVIDKPGRYTSPTDPGLANQLAFADEAIAALDTFFGDLGKDTTVDPTTPPTTPPATTPPATTPPTTPPTGEKPSDVLGTVAVSGDLRPGGTITVKGSGLAEGTSGFTVEIRSTPQTLGTVSTDASGAFTFTGKIPTSIPAGAHTIAVTIDGVTVASAAVTVQEAAAASQAGLADTGAGFVGPLTWAAIALLLAAAAVITIARVRSRSAA
ncbi:hypothetical protein [Agromyces aureus]|uniref:Uncharacterized protein n=1 Tax=Agromyces aureus TaxID=453304 RepID=A0A191WII0_9MICO|nr:hypothetical protein [Agromyces aureus]ANJ28066.1 hypothetical protein ATC03_16470 [Agromyces aureus]